MSNHSGSYMLNEVLRLLDEYKVFDSLGREQTQNLTLRVIKIGNQYDCNYGEILDEMAQTLGVCERCANPKQNLVDGLCEECRLEDDE